MTPEQLIKREILEDAIKLNDDLNWEGEITSDNIDEAYETVLVENDCHWDFESEFRGLGETTDVPCDYSRHYESNSVAYKLGCGTWVGWTYWYGGGKHGDPDSIEWMDDAYELDVTEEQKTVTVRTFKKEPSSCQSQ